MKKYLFILLSLAVAVSCHTSNNKIVTYEDAEKHFIASLTSLDTSSVISMTNGFMEFLVDGKIDSAVQQINVLDGEVLYKSSSKYLDELSGRFSLFPVLKYELVRYSFSTEGNNDVCYKYWFDESHTMKLVFNPVKVDDRWYLTMKDGTQSSKDLDEDKQVHPKSIAPEKIVLNTAH